MAAATFAETKDFPTLGVAERTPSSRQPRSRCIATSFDRIKLKVRELAFRLSKPCTKRRRASALFQANSTAWLRAGRAGAILTCLMSEGAPDRGSSELCCKAILPRQEAAKSTRGGFGS